MRRRLYFVLPNIRSAQAMMNELLLERIDENHIHFHAKNDQLLGSLPKANAVEKSDVVYSAMAGFVFGAVFGLLGGMLAYLVPWWFGEVTLMVIPYCMVLGALSCAAWAAAVATAAPSDRLKSHHTQIEQGNILMIVSVPLLRLSEVRQRLMRHHPEAMYSGVWPAEHSLFP
ncbi:hypothetical protein [Methylophilus sp. 5]|uniref:hypothetical protein n=1 Tax=Methylophilus sp. 5 TaxID=1112274 RepID=UPI00048BCF86|nr:hypothetical protein [Methylophilus sp. 5]